MNFCPKCGSPVSLQIPDGDTRSRHICNSCQTIHYENPRNVVGTIPVWEDKVLLCKRAIEPRLGFWTLPAGFLEINESTQAGAERETFEEAGAVVEVGPLFSLLNVIHAEQVHLFYLAKMHEPIFSVGVESLEVRLFSESEIPWDEIAFTTVTKTLDWFFADRANGLLVNTHLLATHLHDIGDEERVDRTYKS